MPAVASESAEYPVRAVAERLGIPTATLRSWNQRYGIGPRQPQPGRHRYYTESDIAVASRMVELIRGGASPASAAQTANALCDPAPAVGDIESLLEAAFRFDSTELSAVIESHLRHHGVITTWECLFRPAFAEVMARQHDTGGCIDIEHLLSWAVLTGLHRVVAPVRGGTTAPAIILACADGETHTLPLEALRAALAENGVVAQMLGASVPAEALVDAVGRQDRYATVVLWAQHDDTAHEPTVCAVLATGARVVRAGPGWSPTSESDGLFSVNSLADALGYLTEAAFR